MIMDYLNVHKIDSKGHDRTKGRTHLLHISVWWKC